MNKLSNHLEIGVFELNVKDLSLMKDYYHLLVGLEIINESNTQITLGFKNKPILKLILNTHLEFPRHNEPGLYHSAIAFSDRATLARTIKRILINYPTSFSGSADHLVSEAFYFYDPEGNGLELYFDKDSENWEWKDGLVTMDTLFLNVKDYIDKYSNIETNGEIIKTGHIHLKVSSLKEAEEFYLEILGFVKVSEFPGAVFISDGKYHHHIGINIWETKGSEKNSQTFGLRSFEIILEKTEDLENLKTRLENKNIAFTFDENFIELKDPWQNLIRFTYTS